MLASVSNANEWRQSFPRTGGDSKALTRRNRLRRLTANARPPFHLETGQTQTVLTAPPANYSRVDLGKEALASAGPPPSFASTSVFTTTYVE